MFFGRTAHSVKSTSPATKSTFLLAEFLNFRKIFLDFIGFCIIGSSLLVGSIAGAWSGLPISGSVLGMVILLCLLRLSIVPPQLVERPAAALLYLLPALFVPLYVGPFSDATFWLRYGPILLPIVIIGVGVMMALAWLLTTRMMRDESPRGPAE